MLICAVLCYAVQAGYRAAAVPVRVLVSDVGLSSSILDTCKGPCMCASFALMDESYVSIVTSS